MSSIQMVSILLGLLVNELCEFSPWAARKIVRWAARRRYTNPANPDRAEVRAEELAALIDSLPGKLFKLVTALCFAVDAIRAATCRGLTQQVTNRVRTRSQRLDLDQQSMAGTVAFGSSDPFIAAQLGDALDEGMTLTVRIDDVDAFFADRRAAVSGFLDCEILGGRLPIERGGITVVPGNETYPGPTLEYWLDFVDQTGRELTLLGTRTIRHRPELGLWRDATTLDVRLFPRQEHRNGSQLDYSQPASPPVLSGQLQLSPLPFLRRVTLRILK